MATKSLQGSPETMVHEAVKVKPTFSGELEKLKMMLGTWNVCQGKLQVVIRCNTTERPWGLQSASHRGRAPQNLCSIISCYYVPQNDGHGTVGLNVCLLGFGVALVSFLCITLPFSCGIGMFTSCHWILRIYNLFFEFYSGS